MNILNRLFKKHKQPPTEQINKNDRCEIVLSGSGGQGMILAGKILAEAVALYDKKYAIMAQSYGPEARGGASRAEVIISSNSIDYPKVMQTDILLAMTQEAMDKFGGMLDQNGLLIIDETLVKNIPEHIKNVFKAPFSLLAIKRLDAPIVANVIALGALAAITKITTRESLIKAVVARVSKKVLAIDRMAVDTGFKVAEDSGFHWEKAKGTTV